MNPTVRYMRNLPHDFSEWDDPFRQAEWVGEAVPHAVAALVVDANQSGLRPRWDTLSIEVVTFETAAGHALPPGSDAPLIFRATVDTVTQ